MKKSILSLAWALISVMGAYAQNANECIVNATMNGVPDGTEMEAILAATHRDEKALAKGVVKGGKLSLTIPVTEARFIGVGPKNGVFAFTLMTKGGENVQVSLDAKPYHDGTNTGFQTKNIKVAGSAMHAEYQARIGSVKDMLDKMYSEISVDQATLEANQKHFFETVESSYAKMYADNKDSWWGPFAMLNTLNYFTKENSKEWDSFSEAAKNSFYGQLLNEQIYPKSFAGEALPQFDLLQEDGSKVSMASCVKGKKYYLVDFWASWCRPCRKEIPNLKNLYQLYKDKGFQIVSVSIDKNEAAWKKALAEELLPWPNGLDRAGIADSYKVKFIPAIFLVEGATGKCLVENIRGEELAAKLAELFAQ